MSSDKVSEWLGLTPIEVSEDVMVASGEKEVGLGHHGEPSKVANNADDEAVEPSLAVPGVKGKGVVEQC